MLAYSIPITSSDALTLIYLHLNLSETTLHKFKFEEPMVKYDNFSNLLAPETMNLGSYDYLSNHDNPNFKIENNVGTFVLRWEYKPGSTIFVVYNINENRYFSASDNEWSKESNNAFVIKLNYWSKI